MRQRARLRPSPPMSSSITTMNKPRPSPTAPESRLAAQMIPMSMLRAIASRRAARRRIFSRLLEWAEYRFPISSDISASGAIGFHREGGWPCRRPSLAEFARRSRRAGSRQPV